VPRPPDGPQGLRQPWPGRGCHSTIWTQREAPAGVGGELAKKTRLAGRGRAKRVFVVVGLRTSRW
jgi:hypothetical protein